MAWFSPLFPSRSGIAAYSAEVLPLLQRPGLSIETFSEEQAHDFVWKHRRRPFDLTVFHLGNARCHDYMWGYLFRYPGLAVLHDAQLHQARALMLTKRWEPRRADYLAEFRANHPEAPSAAAELVTAGLGSLYQHWPFVRLVIGSARMTLVHNRRLRDDLQEKHPSARIAAIEMGVPDVPPSRSRTELRQTLGLSADDVVVGIFGGMTPEKRIGSVLRAVSTMRERYPQLRVLLVGAPAAHYDVAEEARRWGVGDRVHVTGFIDGADLPDHQRVADICACLRWPTNRETSASWLRCIAAGLPTLVTDLADHADVPTLDPRGWQLLDTQHPAREPVAVSIDPVDEEHSLALALDALVGDVLWQRQHGASDAAAHGSRGITGRLGSAARRWWQAHHRVEAMADAYERMLAEAARLPIPRPSLPAHLLDDDSAKLRALSSETHVASSLRELLTG